MPHQRNELQTRLDDCKEYLLNEQRSKKPSKLYIDDLQQTIKNLEYQIKISDKNYELVKL